MQVGTLVKYVGDAKQSRLRPGMLGVVTRVGRRGVDVKFTDLLSESTGVVVRDLERLAAPSPEQLRLNFAARHGVDPNDNTAMGNAAVEHDNGEVFAVVVINVVGVRALEIARLICETAAMRCLHRMWDRLEVELWIRFAAVADDRRTFDHLADQGNALTNHANFQLALRRLTLSAVNFVEDLRSQYVRAATRIIQSLEAPLSVEVANLVFHVFNANAEASVRDAVVAVLTRRHTNASLPGGVFTCNICTETHIPHCQVFTTRGGVSTEAGTVCFHCLLTTTAVHSGVWGGENVLVTNTRGWTRFMLNNEPISYVLYNRRLYSYAEFVGAFNQHGIGARLRISG